MAENNNHIFEDTIYKTSPYGFILDQHKEEDRWLNYGKFYNGEKSWKEGVKVQVKVQERKTPDKTYWNIQEIVGLNGTPIPDSIGAETNFPDRQVLIVRQSSWDRAIAYANANKIKNLEEITELAHFIEEDVLRPQKFKDDIPF